MRRLRSLMPVFAALALAAALPARAHAQIEQGDKRFSLQGNITKSTAAGSDVEGDVTGELGWYIRRNLAFKLGAGMAFSGSTALGVLAVGSELNWSDPGDTKVPFVSADVGTVFGSGLSSLVVKPGVGAHFFLSRQTSFDVLASYTYTFVKIAGLSGDDGTIGLNFGFSFFFGGGAKR